MRETPWLKDYSQIETQPLTRSVTLTCTRLFSFLKTSCPVSNALPLPNPFSATPPLNVLITGGTGFIGSALVAQLLEAGHQALVLTRHPARAQARPAMAWVASCRR